MLDKIMCTPSDVLVHRMLAQFEGFAAKVESQDANGVEAIKLVILRNHACMMCSTIGFSVLRVVEPIDCVESGCNPWHVS